MSIPELKRSFDALDHATDAILRGKKAPAQQVKDFQAAWRRIFGRPVEASAASAYLQVKGRSVGKGTRRSQKGGATAALSGAPLDFQTRPGIDGVHGSFPPYLTSGLGFYDKINQEGMFQDCGKVDITPQISASMGSNKALLGGGGSGGKSQKGGGLLGTLSDASFVLAHRPLGTPMGTPPTVFNDIQTYWNGRQLGASPAIDQNPNLPR